MVLKSEFVRNKKKKLSHCHVTVYNYFFGFLIHYFWVSKWKKNKYVLTKMIMNKFSYLGNYASSPLNFSANRFRTPNFWKRSCSSQSSVKPLPGAVPPLHIKQSNPMTSRLPLKAVAGGRKVVDKMFSD